MTCCCFFFVVRAEKDFQGYHTEQTKGTTVKKDLLLKKENTIGHGTEAFPTENTHQHTAVAVAAKFPETVLFDTRPTPPLQRIQTTKALTVIASLSKEGFISRNRQNSLTSEKDNPAANGIHIKSEIPLISNYEKIVFSSSQAALKSIMNGTSESEVRLSTDAVKSFLWPHTLRDNRNHRSTDSIPLTSADRRPGVQVLSASHPHVIDNLAALQNDNDDKRAQGKDEKGISTLRRNKYLSGTVQSIFQNDTAEVSFNGSAVTNLCLTCHKDRRAVFTEESVAQPELSPDVSSDSLSTTVLTLDFNEFTTSLQNLLGKQEEILNKNISYQNNTNHSTFGVREQQQFLSNLTFSSSLFNKTMKSSQSSHLKTKIKTFLSDKRSSVTQKDTKKQSRNTYPGEAFVTETPISTNPALDHSSKLLYTMRKLMKNRVQKIIGEKVSTGDPQSKLHFSNSSHSLSTNFKNVLILHQPLDLSSGSVSNTPVITEAAHSSQKSVLQEGRDHSAASHPTARMRLIEAHRIVVPFSFGKPTTSALKNSESHSLTGRAASLISVLRNETTAKPSSQTTELILTLLRKDFAIEFTSATTETQNSQTFNTLKSIVQQSAVYPSGSANKPGMKEPQFQTFTSRKNGPVTFSSDSRQEFDDVVSTLTLTTLPSKPSSDRLTMNRVFRTPSKITQEKTFDVTTHQPFAKYNTDLSRETQIGHSLKLGDKNEQVLTVAAETQDEEIIKTESQQSEEIKETKEILKLQKEEESSEEKLENKRLLKSDKTESRKKEEIINTGVEINKETGIEGQKIEEHKANTSREEGGGTIGEEDATKRQNKDPTQEEVRDEEGIKRIVVTKINIEHFTKDAAAKQRECLTKEGAEAGREETASKKDLKHNREIGREDVTNVPLGATTDSKELNRDKGHTAINSSSCHSLIKQLEATEQNGIHLENTAQIVEMKNKTFSYNVTNNDRQLHSTLRSQSAELSRMTSLPKELHTQIKPCLSTHEAMITKHRDTSAFTKESAQNKLSEATFSVTVMPKTVPKHTSGVSTSRFSDTLKPANPPHSTTTKSAHPVLNSISNVLSLTTPRLAITAGFLRAQPHVSVNSSTLSLSIIYSISNHRHKFSTSVSNANSLLQIKNEREQAKHTIPVHIFESRVKDPLTSNLIDDVNISTSVNPAPPQQMYSDSSTRPITDETLSSEAHISKGWLQPHQGQPAGEISRSSSPSCSDMTSGQKCSFKLSEQTAHSEALHAPVNDNRQRSVQTLMATMSPEAKNDQFPLSDMSLMLNPMLFGGDSLPGTYILTAITRSVSEKENLRANLEDEFAKSVSDHAESLLLTADETNQTEENYSVQNVSSAVKHSDAVTKQMREKTDKMNISSFIAQTTRRSKHHANNADEFNSLSITQTDKLAVQNTNENDHNNLFNVDEANKTVKLTLDNDHLSQIEGYNETSTKPIMFALQTTHNTEQAINEDFLPVANDFAILVLDTNHRTATTALTESDNLPEISQIEANYHTEKTTEKHHGPSILQGTVRDNAITVPHISFRSDLKVPNTFTQQIGNQILDATSEFQIITTKTNDFVSPTASINGLMSSEAHKSELTTSERMQVVTEKSSQAAHAERMVQINSQIESLSLREPLATSTPGKYTTAVKGKNASETRNVEKPEHEISAQATEQSQRAPPGVMVTTRPVTNPVQHMEAGLLKAVHRAGGTHDRTPTMVEIIKYSSFKDNKTALTTKSSIHEGTSAVHTVDKSDQHMMHTLSEKTSISQVILRAMTDSVPHTGIIKKNCSTLGCAASGKTKTIGTGEMDHTAAEKMYKKQAGNTGRDYFKAMHTPNTKPENGNCSSDCPVPGKATPQAANLIYAVFSPTTSTSDHGHATVDELMTKNAKSMTDETSTKMQKAHVETDDLETRGARGQAHTVEETTQRHSRKETSETQEANATEVILSQPEAMGLTTIKDTEGTMLTEKNTKTPLNVGAAETKILVAQNATRSVNVVAKGEMAVQESGRRLLLLEPESEPKLPIQKHRRRTSPHLYLSG